MKSSSPIDVLLINGVDIVDLEQKVLDYSKEYLLLPEQTRVQSFQPLKKQCVVGRKVLNKHSAYLNKVKGWKEYDYHDKIQYIKREKDGKLTNFVCYFFLLVFKVEGVSLSLASK